MQKSVSVKKMMIFYFQYIDVYLYHIIEIIILKLNKITLLNKTKNHRFFWTRFINSP